MKYAYRFTKHTSYHGEFENHIYWKGESEELYFDGVDIKNLWDIAINKIKNDLLAIDDISSIWVEYGGDDTIQVFVDTKSDMHLWYLVSVNYSAW